jgi:hypothetical protein
MTTAGGSIEGSRCLDSLQATAISYGTQRHVRVLFLFFVYASSMEFASVRNGSMNMWLGPKHYSMSRSGVGHFVSRAALLNWTRAKSACTYGRYSGSARALDLPIAGRSKLKICGVEAVLEGARYEHWGSSEGVRRLGQDDSSL